MSLSPEGSKFIACMIGHHSGLAWLPAGGADLTVLISVLECFDHAEDLIDIAADRQIVHAELTKGSLFVDDISRTKGNTLVLRVLKEAAIVAGDALCNIGDHGHSHGAKATSLSRLHGVLSVGELRIDRATDKLAANGLELGSLVTELADLSWAHKSEIEGPEEQDNVLAYKLF